MGCIVCATRGGAGSRAVQEKAIELAIASQDKLLFLYVIDLSSVSEANGVLENAIRDELRWLGQTLLKIAQMRAENSGIRSEVVIREGPVREEIVRFLAERDADLLLLGAPRGTTVLSYGDDAIEMFAEEIRLKSGVQTEIVRPLEPA